MNSLVILAMLVAVVAGDGTVAEWESCESEIIAFKNCSHDSIGELLHSDLEQLRKFIADVNTTCFTLPNVTGICKLPDFQPPTSPAPNSTLTQQPHDDKCFQGAKQAVWDCVKKNASIPDGFKPRGFSHPPPPPHACGPFPRDPKGIYQFLLQICKNDKNAVKALSECTEKIMPTYGQALMELSDPIRLACKAIPQCANKSISDTCKPKLQRGREAFCNCRGEFTSFINKSEDCKDFRNKFNKSHEELHEKLQAHFESLHDHVNPPAVQPQSGGDHHDASHENSREHPGGFPGGHPPGPGGHPPGPGNHPQGPPGGFDVCSMDFKGMCARHSHP